MTDTLFNQSTDQVTIDESKNYLEELVGDGKKFKSSEDLAKGKYHADQTIAIQNKRLDEMTAEILKYRDETSAKARLEELFENLQKKQLTSNENTTVNEETKPAIDPQQIESLISNKIVEYEATKKQQENFNQVQTKLKEQLGTNYTNVLKDRAQELGLSEDDLNVLARKSPKAFFSTLGLETQTRQDNLFQSPPRSQERQDNFAPKGGQKRTWSYYQELKKKDPDILYDRKIANQMAQDAVELGDAFCDGDFYVSGLHER